MNHPCLYCGTPINPATPGVGRLITGWEKVRDQGGANQIIDRQETGDYSCCDCLSMIRIGLNPTSQSSLL